MNAFLRLSLYLGCLAACLFSARPTAAATKALPGNVPLVINELHLQPEGRLPANTNLNLAIGLPLRNPAALSNFLEQVYDPASTNFHHYLTPEQFTQQFSPSLSDYQAVQDFARSNRLAITQTYSNRQLLDVTGSASNIEKAFHINLLVYQHPTEPRKFFAPDAEPTVEATLPILSVSGLNDYTRPRPLRRTNSLIRTPKLAPRTPIYKNYILHIVYPVSTIQEATPIYETLNP